MQYQSSRNHPVYLPAPKAHLPAKALPTAEQHPYARLVTLAAYAAVILLAMLIITGVVYETFVVINVLRNVLIAIA